MAKVRVTFKRIEQGSQEYGSDDEHMISEVFDLETDDGRRFPDLRATVKQIVGGKFETDPLEVSAPEEYNGPFNHAAFQAAAERYYRSCVGANASMFRMGPGAKGIRLIGNVLHLHRVEEFDVEEGGGW
jgi:hypothetical protein